MPSARLCSLTLLALCGLAAPAGAQPPAGTLAPPGNSGVDQYVETVPTHRGPSRAGRGNGTRAVGEANRGAAPVSAGTRRRLRERGPRGVAVEQLTDAAGPAPDAAAGEVVEAARGGSGVVGTAVSRGVGGTGGGGLATGLPLLLAAIAIGGIAIRLRRRRAEP